MSKSRRNKKSYSIKDASKEYKPIYLPKHKYHTDSSTYTQVNIRINELLVEKMIQAEMREFKIPERLGTIQIVKRKTPKRKRMDYQKTKELGTPVFHSNRHSNKYFAMFRYSKKNALYTNKSVYQFKPVRDVSRALAKVIKEKNTILKYDG